MDLAARLTELGMTLPPRPAALAVYVPAKRVGSQILVSGQLPMDSQQQVVCGSVPGGISIEGARAAAATCALNGLAAVDSVLDGDWNRFVGIARLGVFVSSDPGFDRQHLVANGASELLADIFGEAGRHVRAAVGVTALPLGACVEVEMAVEVQ